VIENGDEFMEKILRSCRKLERVVRKAALPIAVPALVLFFPLGFDEGTREMSAIINSIASCTAEECEGATMCFTDGSFDASVEVASALRGGRLKTLSMMSKGSAYEISLRVRGETNELSRSLLTDGAAAALRTWVLENDPCVSNIALQVGAELWRTNSKDMPKAGGFVMRPGGFPEGAAEKGASEARKLAARILRLRKQLEENAAERSELGRMLSFGQWRLSRMCRMRANEAERAGRGRLAEMENELAQRLDEANPEWRKVQERMSWLGRQDGMRLTASEGLRLGLERADFRLARTYARSILESKPDDVKANFAMGMSFLLEKQYAQAEKHLAKCLEKSPNEPAILNNLAIVQLRRGNYAQAETNALRALKLYPDSSEIKTTLRHIRAAIND
jgi:tetratricopeptide (TPR) repeat protein